MTIFFDHQTFSNQTYGGISRYYAELIAGINQTTDTTAYLPILFSNNVYLREKGIPARPFFARRPLPKKIQLIQSANKLYTIPKLRQKSYDVFHATYYDPYFLPYLKGRPFVITFLDMIHEKLGPQFPELADDRIITNQKRLMATQATRIIAISESTKRDIVELLDVDPAKIDVIYLGSSLAAQPVSQELTPTAEPYLLFVGNRGHYKNFSGLLQAIHPLLKQYRLKLVCAGGGGFTAAEKTLIQAVGAGDLVEQQPFDDQTLRVLYQQALAFIFPTLYEGFGIPVLEAFACNCPCIVSNLSSLPEVAGNAALYIDPTSSDSITQAVEQLIHNPAIRQELIRKGREQLSNFSWDRTVTETVQLYKAIA